MIKGKSGKFVVRVALAEARLSAQERFAEMGLALQQERKQFGSTCFTLVRQVKGILA